jgi:hypothetical protein
MDLLAAGAPLPNQAQLMRRAHAPSGSTGETALAVHRQSRRGLMMTTTTNTRKALRAGRKGSSDAGREETSTAHQGSAAGGMPRRFKTRARRSAVASLLPRAPRAVLPRPTSRH